MSKHTIELLILIREKFVSAIFLFLNEVLLLVRANFQLLMCPHELIAMTVTFIIHNQLNDQKISQIAAGEMIVNQPVRIGFFFYYWIFMDFFSLAILFIIDRKKYHLNEKLKEYEPNEMSPKWESLCGKDYNIENGKQSTSSDNAGCVYTLITN